MALPAKQESVCCQIQLLSCKPCEPGQVGPALTHIYQRIPKQCNWFYRPLRQPVSMAK